MIGWVITLCAMIFAAWYFNRVGDRHMRLLAIQITGMYLLGSLFLYLVK